MKYYHNTDVNNFVLELGQGILEKYEKYYEAYRIVEFLSDSLIDDRINYYHKMIVLSINLVVPNITTNLGWLLNLRKNIKHFNSKPELKNSIEYMLNFWEKKEVHFKALSINMKVETYILINEILEILPKDTVREIIGHDYN